MSTSQYNAVIRIQSMYTQQLLLDTISRRPEWNVIDIPCKPVIVQQSDTIQQYKSINDSYWCSKVDDCNQEEKKLCATDYYTDTDFTTPIWSTIQLQIDEFERLGFEVSMSSATDNNLMIISAYPVRKGLIRKSNMCYLLQKYARKRSTSCLNRCIPRTYVFELEDVDYIDEALNDCYEVRDMRLDGSEIYIMKAAIVDKAQSIHIITDPQQIYDICISEPDIREYIIQQYIVNPLLINSKKFHIRVYVLCVGNLTVYVHQEMLCLFATHKYNTDYTDVSAHITNTCVNESVDGFNETEQIQLLTEVMNDSDCVNITSQINACIHDVFECLHSEPMYFMPSSNSYELYGFDFMIDTDHHVYLLEANAQPDFSQTLDRLKYVVENVIENTFQLAIDTRFHTTTQHNNTKSPATDTMKLVYQRINTTQNRMRYY